MTAPGLLPLPVLDGETFTRQEVRALLRDYARANVTAATAPLREEVAKWKGPCTEWLDKTDWVQRTATARELGLHRADVLRTRIEQAHAATARLAQVLQHVLATAPDRLPDPVRREAAEALLDINDVVQRHTRARPGQSALDYLRETCGPQARTCKHGTPFRDACPRCDDPDDGKPPGQSPPPGPTVPDR